MWMLNDFRRLSIGDYQLPAIFMHICLDLLFGGYNDLKNVTITPGIFGEACLHHLSYKIAISRKLINILDHLVK